jgi:hypothetical protein
MNEKLFDLAEEHGWIDDFGRWNFQNDDKLLRFAELVRQDEREQIIEKNKPEIEKVNAYIKDLEQAVLAEREACAKVCEDLIGTRAMARHCADAIRARGGEK